MIYLKSSSNNRGSITRIFIDMLPIYFSYTRNCNIFYMRDICYIVKSVYIQHIFIFIIGDIINQRCICTVAITVCYFFSILSLNLYTGYCIMLHTKRPSQQDDTQNKLIIIIMFQTIDRC